jgi:hypothetical protein
MRKYRILFFSLFFIACDCFAGKLSKLILPENVDSVVLERVSLPSYFLNPKADDSNSSKRFHIPSEEDIFRKYWNVSSAYEECIN